MERTNRISNVVIVSENNRELSEEMCDVVKRIITDEFLMYTHDVTLFGLNNDLADQDCQPLKSLLAKYPDEWKKTEKVRNKKLLGCQAYHFILIGGKTLVSEEWVQELKKEQKVLIVQLDKDTLQWKPVHNFNMWNLAQNIFKSIRF
jgi:hypothetical protein